MKKKEIEKKSNEIQKLLLFALQKKLIIFVNHFSNLLRLCLY